MEVCWILLKLHLVLQQFKCLNVFLTCCNIRFLPRLSAMYLYDVMNCCVTILTSYELSYNIYRITFGTLVVMLHIYIACCTFFVYIAFAQPTFSNERKRGFNEYENVYIFKAKYCCQVTALLGCIHLRYSYFT